MSNRFLCRIYHCKYFGLQLTHVLRLFNNKSGKTSMAFRQDQYIRANLLLSSTHRIIRASLYQPPNRMILKTTTLQMGSLDDNTSGGTYAYRASKAALNQVTKSLTIDLEPQGITVALLHPGWVRTDITSGR